VSDAVIARHPNDQRDRLRRSVYVDFAQLAFASYFRWIPTTQDRQQGTRHYWYAKTEGEAKAAGSVAGGTARHHRHLRRQNRCQRRFPAVSRHTIAAVTTTIAAVITIAAVTVPARCCRWR